MVLRYWQYPGKRKKEKNFLAPSANTILIIINTVICWNVAKSQDIRAFLGHASWNAHCSWI